MHRAEEGFRRFLEEVTADGVHEHNVEHAYMAAVGYEKILKACVLEEQLEESGYSGNRGRYTARGEYSRDGGYSGGYDDGDSYRRRDSGGRYTRDGGYSGEDDSYGRHWVRGHYSRDDGREDMMGRMRRMMEGADPEERKTMERMLRNMENA